MSNLESVAFIGVFLFTAYAYYIAWCLSRENMKNYERDTNDLSLRFRFQVWFGKLLVRMKYAKACVVDYGKHEVTVIR